MSDFNALLDQAAKIVSAVDPHAHLGQIAFRPKDQAASQAADMTTWNFVYSTPSIRVVISLVDGQFDKPQRLDGGLVSKVMFSPPLKKSLDEAFAILRQGGYGDPVTRITLYQPLNFDPSTPREPSYYVELTSAQSSVIAVGANSGQLTVVALPSDDRAIADR
jgi:hypothetical protein